jgi:hypothetical protein
LSYIKKPKDKKKDPKPAVKIYKDGREVCNMLTPTGRAEYRRRREEMWHRQGDRCSLQISPQCKAKKGKCAFDLVQFEHSDGRGFNGSHRDDRTFKDGKNYNSASCPYCNAQKASRRLEDLIDSGEFDGILFS